MNRTLISLGILMSSLNLWAQTEEPATKIEGVTSDEITQAEMISPENEDTKFSSFTLPYQLTYPTDYAPHIPSYRWGYYGVGPWHSMWDIHPGFNASFETGVSVAFGRHNPYKGAAFFSGVTALYAHPINERLTLALGMTADMLYGWGTHTNNIGILALVNYRINERLDLTGFVNHNFGAVGGNEFRLNGRQFAYPVAPGMIGPSTTIGADLGIKVNDNTKINVGVSFTRENTPFCQPVITQEMHNMDRTGR